MVDLLGQEFTRESMGTSFGHNANITAFDGTEGPAWEVMWANGLEAIKRLLATSAVLAFRQTYSTTTTDADPGSGAFRFNHLDPALATQAYVDLLNSAGADISGIIDLIAAGTSAVKGRLMVGKLGDTTAWWLFSVSAVTTASGYRKLALTFVATGGGTLAADDELIVAFDEKGDKGDTPRTSSTSTTSLAVGTGAKAFVTAAALDLGVGSPVVLKDAAAPTTNWMQGTITAIAGTSVTASITDTAGSGTITSWTVALCGERGATGATPTIATTSTTSLAIGTGSKALTTAAALALAVGATVKLADSAAPSTNYMVGDITAIAGTSLTVNVTATGGSGTITSWTVQQSGIQGIQGIQGLTGDAKVGIATSVGGTANAITATVSAIGTLADGHAVLLTTGASANTAAVTFALNGGTAREILKNGASLAANDLPAGSQVLLVYSATATKWLLVGAPAAASSGSGSGGFPADLETKWYLPTTSLLAANATITSGNQQLVYGFYIPNTNGSNPVLIDLQYYDASAATAYTLVTNMVIPAGGVLVCGSLEPLFVMDAGDELRIKRGSTGNASIALFLLARSAATDYEMAIATVGTSYGSRLAAITGSVKKRVVSVLVGNNTTSNGPTYITQAHYTNANATDNPMTYQVPVASASMFQAVADGLGPRLIVSDAWKSLASAGSSLVEVVVAKVS